MTKTTLKDLKKGEWFTLKPIEEPTEKQVFIKDDYNRTEKKYICGRFDDISYSRLLKGSTVVYIGFTF